MIHQLVACRKQLVETCKKALRISATSYQLQTTSSSGFTLIETLVAISFLTLAILAPMSLASQSLASAYYARDQVTAFHLAQEALEAVRSARDANVLENAFGTATDLLDGIPTDVLFVVDTRDNRMTPCSGSCPPLQTDGDFYAYGPVGSSDIYASHAGWVTTRFTREIRATFVSAPDEIKVSATVKWKTGRFQEREFTISENLYRWIDDGAAVEEVYAESAYYSEATYYSESTYYSEGSYAPSGQWCRVFLGVTSPACPAGESCVVSGSSISGTCQ